MTSDESLPTREEQNALGTKNTANAARSNHWDASPDQRIDSLGELVSQIKLDRAFERVRLSNVEESASTLRQENMRLLENERNNQARYDEAEHRYHERGRELADALQQITDLENRLQTRDREFDNELQERTDLQARNEDLENQIRAQDHELGELRRQTKQLRDVQCIERAEYRNLQNCLTQYQYRLCTIIKVANGTQQDIPLPNPQVAIKLPQVRQYTVEGQPDLNHQNSLQDRLVNCQDRLRISQVERARALQQTEEPQVSAEPVPNLVDPLEPIRGILDDKIIEALMVTPTTPQPQNYTMTTSTCNLGPNRTYHRQFRPAFGKGWWIKQNGKDAWVAVWLQTQY